MKLLKTIPYDIINGEGIRYTIFLSGCSHHCKGCYNPESWNKDNGEEFTKQTEQEIFNYVKQYDLDGITLTGGDPLYHDNIIGVEKLCQNFKKTFSKKNIWLYTGYTYEEIKDLPILKYIDVLVDGEFQQDKYVPNLKWRGSTNQRILHLKDGKIVEDRTNLQNT